MNTSLKLKVNTALRLKVNTAIRLKVDIILKLKVSTILRLEVNTILKLAEAAIIHKLKVVTQRLARVEIQKLKVVVTQERVTMSLALAIAQLQIHPLKPNNNHLKMFKREILPIQTTIQAKKFKELKRLHQFIRKHRRIHIINRQIHLEEIPNYLKEATRINKIPFIVLHQSKSSLQHPIQIHVLTQKLKQASLKSKKKNKKKKYRPKNNKTIKCHQLDDDLQLILSYLFFHQFPIITEKMLQTINKLTEELTVHFQTKIQC